MSNNYFQFKQFIVHQDLCGMKVGTDGTLLGAWANGGRRILDIGTGTGLIAMMMAQRFPEAIVTAIDIDKDACRQAQNNVEQSPFTARIVVKEIDVTLYDEGTFDCIVSNPPYFDNSLTSPDDQRTTARHTIALTYRMFAKSVSRLLSDDGELSVIIPSDCFASFDMEMTLSGFFIVRKTNIKTTPAKQAKRVLIAYKKHPEAVVEESTQILNTSQNMRSDWYRELTKSFYLR